MLKICIFDLDQTLLDTQDMKVVREAGKNVDTARYRTSVETAFNTKQGRHIYSLQLLEEIRTKFPKLKLCVFTRSPRSYAQTVLALAYPDFDWDKLVAFEDVPGRTKPFGDGVDACMAAFDVEYLNEVVLVGDGDIDVRAAYHAGCVAILDRSAWPPKWDPVDHWRALGHIPDAIITQPGQLIEVLADYRAYLPELERALTKAPAAATARFDKINKFVPRELGGDATAFPVSTGGRSFSNYKSLQYRRQWHALSESIHDHKDAEKFPEAWIKALRTFISVTYGNMGFFKGHLHITVIPHRPGRQPRLERLLAQLEHAYAKTPMAGKLQLHFHPGLLAYKPGVRSNSNDKLSPNERFINVRDHLYVTDTKLAATPGQFLVIDDVSTTGSTLIYAKQYLQAAGAHAVTCFSLAMNVSDVL